MCIEYFDFFTGSVLTLLLIKIFFCTLCKKLTGSYPRGAKIIMKRKKKRRKKNKQGRL